MRISVVGGSTVTEETYDLAADLGRTIGKRGHAVVCGGLTGVMEGVCRGAADAGGETIGILPGPDRAAANRFVDTAIATDTGNARNVFVALNGDAMIALPGAHGTLSEIGHALDFGRPVVGLNREPVSGLEVVDSPTDAVEFVERATETAVTADN